MANLRGILGQLPYATQVLSQVAPDASPTRLDEAASRALRRVQLSARAQGAEIPNLEAVVLAARTLLETAGLDRAKVRDLLANQHRLHARHLSLAGVHDTRRTTPRNFLRAFEVVASKSWQGAPGGWNTEACFQETLALARELAGRAPRSATGEARFLPSELEIAARISASGRQHLKQIGHLLPGIRLYELPAAHRDAYAWVVAQGGAGSAEGFHTERAFRDAKEAALQAYRALLRADGSTREAEREFPRSIAWRGFDAAQVRYVVDHRWGVTASQLKTLAALPADLTYEALKTDDFVHGHYEKLAQYTWADLDRSWRTTEALQQALAMIREAL